MQKLLIATALTVSIASIGHAQSYDPDLGSGNVVCKNRLAILQRVAAVDRNGLYAYAMVPYGHVCDSPANTGGGSFEYNRMLKSY